MKTVLVVGDNSVCLVTNYYNALEAAGATPVPCDESDIENLVTSVDGILIPGGCDLNPALYHEKNTESQNINDSLDALEERVLQLAVTYKKPVLGICRGLQLINVFFGGSLVQNVSDCDVHQRVESIDKVHATTVTHDSFLYDIYKKESIMVNSAHHQSIKVLGTNLRAVQYCTDGIIEAIVHETLPIIAVQWHPERMCLANARTDTVDGLCVFTYFVEHYL